jgi:hydroxymethylbilane synthase
MSSGVDGIRLGTRGSALALWQARAVGAMLGNNCTIVVIETSGDRLTHVPLQGRTEKGFFTKEIEEQLLAGKIDAAVHSLKDMPTSDPEGLVMAACLERASAADLLLIRPDSHQPDQPLPLRPGSRVGASSLRRQSLLACFAPDCESAFLRGNVPTRIRKCLEGEYGAIVVARAGIDRLQPELGNLLVYELDPNHWLPAPGQGTIAVQARAGIATVLARLQGLDHAASRRAVALERILLAKFEGGCHTAFGAWARPDGGGWDVRIGLDQPGMGWRQAGWHDSFDACLAKDPAGILPQLKTPEASAEGLCRRIR